MICHSSNIHRKHQMYILHPEIPQDCQRFIAGLPCLPKYCPHFHNHALREAFLQSHSQNQTCNTTTPQANTFKDSFGDKKGSNYMSGDNKNNNNSVNIYGRKRSRLSNKFSRQNTDKTSDHGARSAFFPVLDESKKALNERRNEESAKSFKADSETSMINSFSPLEKKPMQDIEPRESKDFNPITHIPNTDLSINLNPLELNSHRLEGDFDISGASSISNPDASYPSTRNFKNGLDSETFSYVKSPLPQIIAETENDSKPIVNLPKIDKRIPCRPKMNDRTEISNISPVTQSSIDGDKKDSFIFFETSFPIECISKPEYSDANTKDVFLAKDLRHSTKQDFKIGFSDRENKNESYVNSTSHLKRDNSRPSYNDWDGRHVSFDNNMSYESGCNPEKDRCDWDNGQVSSVNVKIQSAACHLRPKYYSFGRRNESLENSTGYQTVHSLEQSNSDWDNEQVYFVNDTNNTTRYDPKVRYNDPEKRDLSHSNSVGHQTGYLKKRRFNSCDRGNVSFKSKSSNQTGNHVEKSYCDLDKRRVSTGNETNHTTGYDQKTMLNEWEKGDLSPSNKTPHQIAYIDNQSCNEWDKAQLSSGNSTSHSTGYNPNQSYNDWYEGDLSPATSTSHPTVHDLNLESSDGKEKDDSLNSNSNRSTGINPKRKYNFWDKRHPSNDNSPSHQSRYNLKSSYRDCIKRDVSLFNGLSHPKGHNTKLEHGDRITGDISSPIDVNNLTEQVSKPGSRDGVKRVVSAFNTKIHPLGYNPKPRQNDGERKNISLANDTCYLTERNSNPKYDGEKKDTPLTIDTNNMTEKISVPENKDGEKKDTPLAIQTSYQSKNNSIPKYNEEKKDTSLSINTGHLIENKANPKHNHEKKTDIPLTTDINNLAEKILIPEKNDGEKKDKSLGNDIIYVTEKSPDLDQRDGNTIDIPVVVDTSHSRDFFPGKKYTDNKEISVTLPVHHPSAKRSTKQKIADLDAKFQIHEVNKPMDSLRMQWINNLSPEIKQAYFRDTTVEKNNKPSRNLNFKRRPMISLVSKSSGEQSFTLFRNLPSEIRNQIWNYAKEDCSTTCYVQLDVKQDPGGRCEIVNGKSVLIPNPILDAKFSYLYDIPGLYGACRESHSIVKDFYGKSKITAFNQATQRPYLSGQGSCIFNYEQDRLFFLTSGTVSRLPECVDFMREKERNMIRHLAIPLKDYFHEPRTTVDALVRFRHLKTLNLVIGDSKDDKEVIGSEDYGRSLRNDLRGQHINDDREISEEFREKWTLPYVKVEYVDESQAHAWGIDDFKWEATMRPIRR